MRGTGEGDRCIRLCSPPLPAPVQCGCSLTQHSCAFASQQSLQQQRRNGSKRSACVYWKRGWNDYLADLIVIFTGLFFDFALNAPVAGSCPCNSILEQSPFFTVQVCASHLLYVSAHSFHLFPISSWSAALLRCVALQ